MVEVLPNGEGWPQLQHSWEFGVLRAVGLSKSQITQGCRVDNEQDIKVLRAYLETYFNPQKLQNGQLPTGQQIPTTNQVKDLINLANKLPEVDVPEFFGLPNNIDKAVQRYAIKGVVSGLKLGKIDAFMQQKELINLK